MKIKYSAQKLRIPRFLVFAFVSLAFAQAAAQTQKCASHAMWEARAQKDPAVRERMAQTEAATQAWIANHPEETSAVITIPTVVHVVYNTTLQNISDAQVQSQIVALNEDFRLLNADSVPLGHPFWPHTADTEIEFCLATEDPDGNFTTGITRTSTSHGIFQGSNSDDVKFTANGGHDNWDPTRYLNIWVCNLGGGLYGYATFPAELSSFPDYDGVVIDFTAFGYIGTVQPPSDLGRTGTHEVGHWLNLHHIWGDDNCGDDLVSDTRPAEQENYGCPSFPSNPFNPCGSDANGEMYMNYMDYVDDSCMVMFTFGQKSRMRAALNGDRAGLQSSGGCGAVASAGDVLTHGMIDIYPNPSSGSFTLNARSFVPRNARVTVLNAMGVKVREFDKVQAFPFTFDLSDLPSDLYFVQLVSGRSMVTEKIVVAH